jgi:gluconolactonase
MCQHGNRRIARQEADGKITAVVDKYQGKRLNSPNDLVYHSSERCTSRIRRTACRSAGTTGERAEVPGVYRLGTDGTLTLLTDELNAPNGLAFSPDEKTLYVAQSDPEKSIWMAYPVKADGTTGPAACSTT